MKIRYLVCVVAVLGGLCFPRFAQAGEFFLPVGLSYSYGSQQLANKLADFYRTDGYDVDQNTVPIGLSLNPFYEWDNGLGVGVSVGPLTFLTVDLDTSSGSSDTDKFSYVVPVGGFVRYTLFRDKTFSPYIRVGVRYPFAGGDNLESVNVGPFGMVGVDIWRNQKVGMSVEVGYDASHVNVKYTTGAGTTLSDKVPYSGFTATVSVLF